MRYEDMIKKGLSVYDASGRKIDKVRGAVKYDGGVTVSVLHTVDNGCLSVLGSDGELVEFTADIKGGQLR